MNQEPASPMPAAAAAASALEGASLNSSLTAMDWLPKGPFLNDVNRPLDPLLADYVDQFILFHLIRIWHTLWRRHTTYKYLPLDERQGGRPGHGRRLGPACEWVVLGLGGRAGPAHHGARQLHLQG